MRLNKLIKKIANFNRLDILNIDGSQLLPIDKVSSFEIEDLKKYKVKQIITYTNEPGIITIYVEECKL